MTRNRRSVGISLKPTATSAPYRSVNNDNFVSNKFVHIKQSIIGLALQIDWGCHKIKFVNSP